MKPAFAPEAKIVCACFSTFFLLGPSISLGITSMEDFESFGVFPIPLAIGICLGLPITIAWVKIFETKSPLWAGLVSMVAFIPTSILIGHTGYATVAFRAWLLYWSVFCIEGIFRVFDRLSGLMKRFWVRRAVGNHGSDIESGRRPDTPEPSDTEYELWPEETATLLDDNSRVNI